MGSRRYSRQTNGRFRRATLENTFGLSCIFCPACRIGNPYQAGSEPAEKCHACGAVLQPVSECAHCYERITLLADQWTTDDDDRLRGHIRAVRPAQAEGKLTMDNFQARALKNLRERHESQIRENAERIRDHIGYVLQRLDADRSDSVGLYAEDIEASARRIVSRVAALEAIADVLGIAEATEGN